MQGFCSLVFSSLVTYHNQLLFISHPSLAILKDPETRVWSLWHPAAPSLLKHYIFFQFYNQCCFFFLFVWERCWNRSNLSFWRLDCMVPVLPVSFFWFFLLVTKDKRERFAVKSLYASSFHFVWKKEKKEKRTKRMFFGLFPVRILQSHQTLWCLPLGTARALFREEDGTSQGYFWVVLLYVPWSECPFQGIIGPFFFFVGFVLFLMFFLLP